ncbi:MAG: hypothetical protein IJK26_09820 [Clostridia bacterium]|nr:hypothetical protein [Clostridia bacterium]
MKKNDLLVGTIPSDYFKDGEATLYIQVLDKKGEDVTANVFLNDCNIYTWERDKSLKVSDLDGAEKASPEQLDSFEEDLRKAYWSRERMPNREKVSRDLSDIYGEAKKAFGTAHFKSIEKTPFVELKKPMPILTPEVKKPKPPKPPAERKPSLRNEPIPDNIRQKYRTPYPQKVMEDILGTKDLDGMKDFVDSYNKGGKTKELFDEIFEEGNRNTYNILALYYKEQLTLKEAGARRDSEFGSNRSDAQQKVQRQLRKFRHPANKMRVFVKAVWGDERFESKKDYYKHCINKCGMYQDYPNEGKTYLDLPDAQYNDLADFMRETAVGEWRFESEPCSYDTVECVRVNNSIDFNALRKYAEKEGVRVFDTEEACRNHADRSMVD